MAIFFILAFGLVSGVSARCTVTTDASPTLVNLKLGMSASEVNSALGGVLKVKVKGDGQVSIFKSYLKKGKAKGVLAGARAFYLRFYEKRLYQAEIFYHQDYGWNDLDSLVRDYSSSTGFAYENFEIENGYAKAECEGFSVKADYVLNPRIEITDEAANEQVKSKK